MTIITISREYGSGGDEIAARLSEVLGYHTFGKNEITRAAEETAMPKHIAVDYTEENHEVQTFLDRLFGRTASPAQMLAWTEDPSIATRPERSDVDDTAVLSLVKRAMKAALKEGNMIIVGRGGAEVLKDSPNVLSVRIIAPIEDRIQRVKTQMKYDNQDFRADIDIRRAAQDQVVKRDMASADYIKKFYDVDWENPMLYHVVLNTGKLTIDQAVLLIAGMVHTMESMHASV